MDNITVKSLAFHGNHGLYDEEREKGNDFEVDISADGFFKASVENNDLSATFNYELAETVARDIISGPPEKLIENLCYKIGERLFSEAENIRGLKVTVRKLNPPLKTRAGYAEITMEWKR